MSAALVPVGPQCATCTHPTIRWQAAQPALLRHGGYGGTTITDYATCPACSTTRITAVTTANPLATS